MTKMRVVSLLLVAGTVTIVACVDVWWESAVVYQIYPRSFKDSNADGIGDLNGITEKLSYLKGTGVDAIWLSPIFKSPMYDFGYDITNYTEIAKEYGTMKDFENLMTQAKLLGVRVILDFVPNHTSNESEWFVKSAQREPQYEDYYIWADGKVDPANPAKLLPPNNWISNFRKSAWEYSETRKQFYLHQFVIGQPDLNYRNITLQQDMQNVLRFWLDKGVSGFRVDAVNMLYEVDPKDYDGKYPDEPPSGNPNATSEDYEYLNHIYTKDLMETYDVVYDWRSVLDEYTTKHQESKIMMTEAYTDIDLMMRYYEYGGRTGSIPFNFVFLGELTGDSTARDMKAVVDKWMTHMPSGKTANWVNGNHDQSRMATRHGTNRVDAMNMLALLLPGVSITYQGEEIGMVDGYVSWNDTKDPQACNTDDSVNYWKKSRDPERTPYQWDATKHAGFSTTNGSTWLPVADNYETLNLAAQMASSKSHYKFYKDVVAAKSLPAVKTGDLDTRALSESVLVVTRLLPSEPAVVGIINLSGEKQTLNLTSMRLLPDSLKVIASGVNCTYEKGRVVTKENVDMSGYCALVFESQDSCCVSGAAYAWAPVTGIIGACYLFIALVASITWLPWTTY